MSPLSRKQYRFRRKSYALSFTAVVVLLAGIISTRRQLSIYELSIIYGSSSEGQTLVKDPTPSSYQPPAPLVLTDEISGNKATLELNCSDDYQGSQVVVNSIQVSSSPTPPQQQTPNILCFLMTHSGSHDTKVQAVVDTWGKRCDRLVIASNVTDDKLGTIELQTPATYELLWDRLNETLHYVWNEYQHEEYDWYFKIDDDSYVIMENLVDFIMEKEQQPLQRLQQQSANNTSPPPLVFGYPLPTYRWKDIAARYFQGSPENRAFGDFFFNYSDPVTNKQRNPDDKADYLHGGAGYVMNRQYLQQLLVALRSNRTLRSSYNNTLGGKLNHDPIPEDLAHGVTMMVHGIQPKSGRDILKRERFLPEPPSLMYHVHQQKIKDGTVKPKSLCCSRSSISFHHISPSLMRYLEYQFYTCRG